MILWDNTARFIMKKTTWDGQPISPEKPHGTTIVVYRWNTGDLEFLILHRAHNGPEYEVDWAWTPPSGARHPGEDMDACARRELFEETGLELLPTLTDRGTEDWYIYIAETTLTSYVQLSVEHDRYQWMSGSEASNLCQPEMVSQQILCIENLLIK